MSTKTIKIDNDYYIRCVYILIWFKNKKSYGKDVGEKYYNSVEDAIKAAQCVKEVQGGNVVIREESFYAESLEEALSDKWDFTAGHVSSMIEEI